MGPVASLIRGVCNLSVIKQSTKPQPESHVSDVIAQSGDDFVTRRKRGSRSTVVRVLDCRSIGRMIDPTPWA